MKQKKLIAGNWKMQLSTGASLETMKAISQQLKDTNVTADVVVCASAPLLPVLKKITDKDGNIQLGAQHVNSKEKGALTGGVSVTQVADLVSWSIVGHSETRANLGVTDKDVVETVALLLKHKITPIICLGETFEEKQAEQTIERVSAQAQMLFDSLGSVDLKKIVIAYEPIWAISTNNPTDLPDPSDVASIMLMIRKLAVNTFDEKAGEWLRVIYGGSVNEETVASFANEPGVDGVLPGGASLHPGSFINIIKTVQDAS